MSSTNKTSKLELNQWVAGDPVLREDFNSDNVKLEAAVEARSYVKLMDITTTSSAAQVDIGLSDIDFGDYSKLVIAARLSATGSERIYVRCNGISEQFYGYKPVGGNADYNTHAGWILANYGNFKDYGEIELILGTPAIILKMSSSHIKNATQTGCVTESWTVHGGVATNKLLLNQLRTINLVSTAGQILSGSRIVVYGVRW